MTTTRDHPLYVAVTEAFALAEHEVLLLEQAVETSVLVDALQSQLDADGLMVPAVGGGRKVHPVVAELRQQRLALARLLVALRIPLDDEGAPDGDEPRTQRRGVRGVYGLEEVA